MTAVVVATVLRFYSAVAKVNMPRGTENLLCGAVHTEVLSLVGNLSP